MGTVAGLVPGSVAAGVELSVGLQGWCLSHSFSHSGYSHASELLEMTDLRLNKMVSFSTPLKNICVYHENAIGGVYLPVYKGDFINLLCS